MSSRLLWDWSPVLMKLVFQYLQPRPGKFISIEDNTVLGTHKGESCQLWELKAKSSSHPFHDRLMEDSRSRLGGYTLHEQSL